MNKIDWLEFKNRVINILIYLFLGYFMGIISKIN